MIYVIQSLWNFTVSLFIDDPKSGSYLAHCEYSRGLFLNIRCLIDHHSALYKCSGLVDDGIITDF